MEKKKRNYQKPEVFVINAEPEMLLAGSGVSTGGQDSGKSIGAHDETFNTSFGNSWNSSDNEDIDNDWDF